MSQERRHSLVEAVVSTGIGFAISYTIWPAVSLLLLHRPVHMGEGAAVVGVFTVISIVRGYLVRRAFNRIHARACFVCGIRGYAPYPGSPDRWLCRYHAGL